VLTTDFSALNTLSSAPDKDCSMFDAWRPMLIADCSALLTLRPVLTADCSVLNTWSFVPVTDYSALDTYRSAPYTDYSVYDTWLLFVAYGFLRTHHLVPCVDRRLLRAQHLVLRAGTFR